MGKWFSVKDKLPPEPDFAKATEEDFCDVRKYCDKQNCDDCCMEEYIVTLEDPSEGAITSSLMYAGEGLWKDLNGIFFDEVVAWQELPEPWKDETKYRWRLNARGWGRLRSTYLVASGVVLMVADWDIPVCKNSYKNVFTEEEFNYLAEKWEFDPELFEKEKVEEVI